MFQGIYIPDNFIDQYIEKRSMYIRIINERCDNGQIDVKTKSMALKSLDHYMKICSIIWSLAMK